MAAAVTKREAWTWWTGRQRPSRLLWRSLSRLQREHVPYHLVRSISATLSNELHLIEDN